MNNELIKIVEEAIILEIENVKSVEDLIAVNDDITDYEREYGFDLKKYRKKLIELKRGYWNT